MTFIVKRLVTTLFVLWGVCTMTFFLIHLTPGDPVEYMLQMGSAAETSALRHALGLDLPLPTQYVQFFIKLFHFNLGDSFINKKPVTELILASLPNTFLLALSSMIVAIVIGLPLGILSAVLGKSKNETSSGALDTVEGRSTKGFVNFVKDRSAKHKSAEDSACLEKHFSSKWTARLIDTYSLIGLSMPSFWLAPLLIIFFSLRLDWFPVNEAHGLLSIVLPTVSLSLGLSAVLIRMTRAAILEVLPEEFVTVARAKGVSEFRLLFKHVLKNAMTPIITILSLQFGAVLTGLVITETIFDWPGLGILLFKSLQSRDYPLVQGCVLLIAFIYVIVNFFTDIFYVIVNPRLRDSS